MRKIFLFALLLGIAPVVSISAQEIEKHGTQYVIKSAPRQVTAPKGDETGKTIKDTDGKVYPLYLSKNGRAYIIRTSKAGNTYRKYLGEKISRAICKDMGREYKETN